MKKPSIETLLILGIGGVAAYYLLSKLSTVGSQATGAVSSGIAKIIENLTFGAPIQATGGLDDQAGNYLGPISSFPAATYGGNTYLQVNGATYQLGPRDSSGNFTAIPVS